MQENTKIRKKRSENWTAEEKDVLRQLICQSAKVLEDKSTKTTATMQKIKEWATVTNKFNEICGKHRTAPEIKVAWKRMKLMAKSKISEYNRELKKTGGGGKPPSPSPEDLEIMAIAPFDFHIESNTYDSDAVITIPADIEAQGTSVVAGPDTPSTAGPSTQSIAGPSTQSTAGPSTQSIAGPSNEWEMEVEVVNDPDYNFNAVVITEDGSSSSANEAKKAKVISKETQQKKTKPKTKQKENIHNNKNDDLRLTIVKNNVDLKRRQIEIMDIEHQNNLKEHNYKIKLL